MRRLLGLLLVAACCHQPPPPPVTPQPGCLTEAPPAELSVKIAGPAQGCPPQFPVCLDVENALRLEHNIHLLHSYSEDAWTRCAPAKSK